MDVVELLEAAKQDGVAIEIVDGDLQIEAPAKKKKWIAKLRPYKQAILDYLTGTSTVSPETAESEHSVGVDAYTEFPSHTLPDIVSKFVCQAAKAIGCDESYIGLPLLTHLARAVSDTRVIRLKRTWTEPAVIWGAIVGNSGTHKTPALDSCEVFLAAKEAEAEAKSRDEDADHQTAMALYARNLAVWKRSKTEEPPPWEPVAPVCKRYTTTDSTVEALAVLFSVQPDGLLVTRDELSGWLGGIGEYKGGGGSDLGHWLSMWSAKSITFDRKTGAHKKIYIPRAAVSLIGGIQPATLRQAIGAEHMADGLCARLLLAMPPAAPIRWTDAIVDQETEMAMQGIFDRLLSLEHALDEHDKEKPFPIDLTPEAKLLWIDYYNRHRAEGVELDDDLAAAWSKLEAYAARFALIFQLCDWAAGTASEDCVDEKSVAAGIELSDWFGNQAKRVYVLFVESPEDVEHRKLVEWIQRKGGRVTARQLQQGFRKYKKSTEAEAALACLVDADLGRWDVVSTGRRQRVDFVLSTLSTPTVSAETAGIRNSVDVDGSSTPPEQSNGDGGAQQ